jgi:hypothetical protein
MSSTIQLPFGTVQDVQFYGAGTASFTLYVLRWINNPAGQTGEQTFVLVASVSVTGNGDDSVGPQLFDAFPQFTVQQGDLLAFAGIGPYYPQNGNDTEGSDATYADVDSSFTATPPCGPGSIFTVGVNGDMTANYQYVDNFFCNQGRTYAIGVDVTEPAVQPATSGTPQQITFAGYRWTNFDGGSQTYGPGNNYWSAVNVADEGCGLLLSIAQQNVGGAEWCCSSVAMDGVEAQGMGYGKYEFWVTGPQGNLDPNVVLGLFLYGPPSGDVPPTDEIDIEFNPYFSTALSPVCASVNNVNYTVLPSDAAPVCVNPHDTTDVGAGTSVAICPGVFKTHNVLTWLNNSVTFEMFDENVSTSTPVVQWTFLPPDPSSMIPRFNPQQPMAVHMNLYLRGAAAPASGLPVEVVVNDFIFTPAAQLPPPVTPTAQPPVAISQTVTFPITPRGGTSSGVPVTLTGIDQNSPPLPLAYMVPPGNCPENGSISGNAPNLLYTPYATVANDSFSFEVNNGVMNWPAATVTLNGVANTWQNPTVSSPVPSFQSATIGLPAYNGQAGVTATLNNTGRLATVTAEVLSSHEAYAFAFGPGSTFLDLQVIGAKPSGSLTAVFFDPAPGPPASAPTLNYYPQTGPPKPVINGASAPPALAGKPPAAVWDGSANWVFTAYLDNSTTSAPTLADLTGTVFAMGALLPAGLTPVTVTSVSSFNDTPIPAKDYIWFEANLTPTGIPKYGTTVYFQDSAISFSANGVSYELPVPDTVIYFLPSASCVNASYDSSTKTWVATAPISGSDEIFLSGLIFPVPVNLPGGINPVSWSGTFLAEPGITINWKWGAAVFRAFNSDYNALGVQPAHIGSCRGDNGDHGGFPENYKQYMTGGACGTGGANIPGGWSGTRSVNF